MIRLLSKYVITLSAISLSVLITLPASAGTPKGKPFVEIQGQFVEVEGQLDSIEQQIDDLVGQVDSLEARVTANENAMYALEAENVLLNEQIGQLIQTSSGENQLVADALAQIQELQGQIDALDLLLVDERNDVQSQINTLQDFVSSNTEGLQTLFFQVQNNLSLINGLNSQIIEINTQLANKQDVLSGACPDGTTLQYFDGEGNIQCLSSSTSSGSGVNITSVTQMIAVGATRDVLNARTCYYGYKCDCNIWSGCDTCIGSYGCNYYTVEIGTGSGQASCPTGNFLAGGGYINEHPDFVNIASSTSTGDATYAGQSWYVSATNSSRTGVSIYATANCVSFAQ